MLNVGFFNFANLHLKPPSKCPEVIQGLKSFQKDYNFRGGNT
jgi:hypothetical protein